MNDRAGNELAIGDEVLYIENQSQNTVHLVWGTIDRFTPQMVVFEVKSPRSGLTRTRRVPPDRVVKPFKE